MNKGELINAYAALTNAKATEAKGVVEAISKIFRDTLISGDEVTLPGVGKLKVQTRPGRTGRNPATGVAIEIPSKRVVKFTPSADFGSEVSTLV